jgi:hypothetical protein
MVQIQAHNIDRFADISYFEPLEVHTREKPYISNVPFLETDGPWHNLNQVKHQKKVIDVRGREADFSLAKNGFEYIRHVFSQQPTDSIGSLGHPYVLEVEQLLQKRFGPSVVLMYDAIVSPNRGPLPLPCACAARVRLHRWADN